MGASTESVRKTIKKSLENVYARVYLSAQQSNLTGNSWVKIALNTVEKDLGLNFDTGTNRFNVPVTGLYSIIGTINFINTVTDKRYLVGIYKNGTSIREIGSNASYVGSVSIQCVEEVFLNEGDYIELFGQSEAGGGIDTVDVVHGSKGTGLTVRLITKEGTRQ